MRDDELRHLLVAANPWWAAAAAGRDPSAWASEHRVLRDRAQHDLGYRASVLDDLTTTRPDGSLTVLTGPRRAGKTVAMLDVAARLCAAAPAIDPRQIIFVACDGMQFRDLRRTITLGRALTRSVDHPAPQPRVWLFDEISDVKGWSAALKAVRDSEAFGDDTVVATGSRWISGEDIQGNLLAGRAGNGTGHRIRQLLPMSFRDFLEITRPFLALPPIVHPSQLDELSALHAVQEIAFQVDELDLAWQDYLSCGGFPRAVAEYQNSGAVSLPYLRDLMAWLRADVDPDGATDSVPLLLTELVARMTSPLNLPDTTQVLGYPSRDVFTRRLNRLVNSHAALRVRQRDDNGRLVAGAQYKFYLTDPLLAWLPSRISPGLPTPHFTALSEITLAVALARAIDRLDEGRWVADDTIGYVRTGSGNEIDLGPVRIPTTAGADMTTPIESKWVDNAWRQEAKVMEAKYGRGILATKSILDLEHPVKAVPAPLLACVLG